MDFEFDIVKHDAAVMRVRSHRGIISPVVSVIEDDVRKNLKLNGELWIFAEDERWGGWIKGDAVEIGKARQAIHAGQKGKKAERMFDDPNEEHIVGVRGELLFGKEFGMEIDEELKRGGDDGYDFKTDKYSIDVKVTRRMPFLLVKECDVDDMRIADILVLIRGDGDDMRLAGWEYGDNVREWPKKRFREGSYMTYYRREEDLLPISDLKKMLGVRCQYGELMGNPWRLAWELRPKGWLVNTSIQTDPGGHLFCMMLGGMHKRTVSIRDVLAIGESLEVGCVKYIG